MATGAKLVHLCAQMVLLCTAVGVVAFGADLALEVGTGGARLGFGFHVTGEAQGERIVAEVRAPLAGMGYVTVLAAPLRYGPVERLAVRQVGMTIRAQFCPWGFVFPALVEPRPIVASRTISLLKRVVLKSWQEERLIGPVEMVALQAGVESHHRSRVPFLELLRPVAPGAGEYCR